MGEGVADGASFGGCDEAWTLALCRVVRQGGTALGRMRPLDSRGGESPAGDGLKPRPLTSVRRHATLYVHPSPQAGSPWSNQQAKPQGGGHMSRTSRSRAPHAFSGTVRTVVRPPSRLGRAPRSLGSLCSPGYAWNRLTLLCIQQRSTDEKSWPPSEFRRIPSESAVPVVIVRNIRHKGVRRLYHRDDRTGFRPNVADKIAKMMAYLQDMASVHELQHVRSWRAHELAGDRNGTWSLHVTGNWRLTFRVVDDEIVNVDYEDYH